MTWSADVSCRSAPRSRPSAVLSLAGATCVSLCLALLLCPRDADAQCVPDPAVAGDTVTCSGTFNQYIVDPGVDDVTVNIVAGTVSNSLAPDVVRVNDDSNITNDGTLNVLVQGSSGMRGGDGASVTDAAAYTNASQGQINVGAQLSWGIFGGVWVNARNEGTIQVDGDQSYAILVGDTGLLGPGDPADSTVAYNSGTILLNGDGGHGLAAAQRAALINDVTGLITIDAAATNSYAFDVQADNSIASNLGTIDAAGAGSEGIHSAANGVAFDNAGSMTFTGADSRGMVGGTNAAITNDTAGAITMQGASSYAIELGSEGTAANLGAITIAGGDSRGLTGLGGTATNRRAIVRNGTVAETGATIDASGTDSFGIHFGDFTRAFNYGTISVSGARSEGIHLDQDAFVFQGQSAVLEISGLNSKGISTGTNSQIFNSGLIDLRSDGGIAVQAGANADIQNLGRVEVRAPNAVGFAIGGQTNPSGTTSGYNLANQVNAASGLPGEILSFNPNAGPLVRFGLATSDQNRLLNDVDAVIRANVSNAATPGLGIAIEGAAGREHIENYGSITGKIELAGGNDTYVQGTSGALADLGAGTLAGGAGLGDVIQLRLSGAETIGRFDIGIADGFESFEVESGLWYVGGSTTSAMHIEVQGAQSSGGRAATLSIVRPVSTQGSYDHLSPNAIGDEKATLEVFLNAQTLASPGLHVASTASLDEGVLDLKIGGGVTGDLTFTVVLADGTILDEFDAIRLDQAGVTFDPIAPGSYAGTNSLDITVHIPGYSHNQAAVTRYLAVLDAAGPSPELQAVIDSINSLAYADYTTAVDELHPEAYDAQTSTMLSLGARFNQAILDRPRYCVVEADRSKVDPKTGLPCNERRWEPWFSAYGQVGKRTGESGQISWTDNGGGLIFGVDGRLDERFLFSGSIGTSYDIIRVEDIGKGRLATIDVGLYAGYTHGPLRLDGVFSYGWGWHTSYRNIRSIPDLNSGYGATATGEFGSDRISTRIQGEYGFDVGMFEIAPVASFDYTYLGQESVSETGADPVSLQIDERKDNIFTIRAGAEVELVYHKKEYWTNWLELADGLWRPNLALRWRQVVVGADRELTAYFQGSPPASTGRFTVDADDADMGIELGAGIAFTPKHANRLTFELRYDGFFWENVTSHDFSGQVRLSF